MEKFSAKELIFWMAVAGLIGLVFGLVIDAGFVTPRMIRKAAIVHHAAYYTCDINTGETTFHWVDESATP